MALVVPNSSDLSSSYLTVIVKLNDKEFVKLRYGANLEKTEMRLILNPNSYTVACRKNENENCKTLNQVFYKIRNEHTHVKP